MISMKSKFYKKDGRMLQFEAKELLFDTTKVECYNFHKTRAFCKRREQLSDASIEIKAYTQGLKKVEAQLVAHQQGQLWHMTGEQATWLTFKLQCGPVAFGVVKADITGTKDKVNEGDSEKGDELDQDCFELPIWHSYSSTNPFAPKTDNKRVGSRVAEQVYWMILQDYKRARKGTLITVNTTAKASGTNFVNTVHMPVSTASANKGQSLSETTNSQEDDNEIPPLEDIHEGDY
ncbi:hypothetical protein Tco_1563643 [Tanacetum coccineum]